MKCGNCGSEIYKGTVYCHVCGKPVAAESEAPPETGMGVQAENTAVSAGTERQTEQPTAPHKRKKSKKQTVLLFCAVLCVLAFGAAGVLWFSHGTATADSGATGNTPSNILNKGISACQGGWIYYTDFANRDSLYKMKTDGTCKTRLCGDMAFYINVSGGWVYYCSAVNNFDIYRVRTDGKDRTRLNSESSDCLTVSGGWMYYIGSGGVTRMKTDGTAKTVLAGNAGNDLFLSGNDLYYNMLAGMDIKAVYKVSSSGGSVETVFQPGYMSLVSVENGWIYYLTYNDGFSILSRARTDGSEKKDLCQFTKLYNINITDGWVYYFDNTAGDHAIRKIKTDGTQAATVIHIPSDCTDMYLNVVGDRIIYDEDRTTTFSMYMVQTDGTQNRLIGQFKFQKGNMQ